MWRHRGALNHLPMPRRVVESARAREGAAASGDGDGMIGQTFGFGKCRRAICTFTGSDHSYARTQVCISLHKVEDTLKLEATLESSLQRLSLLTFGH